MNTRNTISQNPDERPVATTNLGRKLIQEWELQLLERLLSQLGKNERWLLTALAVLNEPFWWGIAWDWLTASQPIDMPIEIPLDLHSLLTQWYNLSLLQFHHTDGEGNFWYLVHPMAREILLDHLDVEHARAFHKQAAMFYAAPFVVEARRYLETQGDPEAIFTEVECEALARRPGGPVSSWTRQTENPRLARWTMERALKWQERLFLAGEYDAANDLVITAWAILASWGQKERAQALLERSIGTIFGLRKGVTQANLAALLQQEGKFKAALETYEQAILLFSSLGARDHKGIALVEIGNIYLEKGHFKRAFASYNASLETRRAIGDPEGQVNCLNQLSVLFYKQKRFRRAFQYSQEAEKLLRSLSAKSPSAYDGLLAPILQTQGAILRQEHHYPAALACFEESLAIHRRNGYLPGQADNLVEAGKVLLQTGELERGLSLIRESTEIRLRLEDPNIGVNYQAMGVYYEKCGDFQAAIEQYHQARIFFKQFQPLELSELRRRLVHVRILAQYKRLIERLRRKPTQK
jgi:tetratricopeptide (TPR) repeat protein